MNEIPLRCYSFWPIFFHFKSMILVILNFSFLSVEVFLLIYSTATRVLLLLSALYFTLTLFPNVWFLFSCFLVFLSVSQTRITSRDGVTHALLWLTLGMPILSLSIFSIFWCSWKSKGVYEIMFEDIIVLELISDLLNETNYVIFY